MKTIITIISICLLSTISFGQDKGLLYATMEDYKNNKPVPDYEIVNDSYMKALNIITFKVKHGGETKRTALEKIPGDFFTFIDYEYGETRDPRDTIVLIRKYKGDPYEILLNDVISFYYMHPFQKRYYSETIAGEVKEYDKKVMDKLLKQHNLFEIYRKEYPKKGNYYTQIQYDIKYLKIISSKLKP